MSTEQIWMRDAKVQCDEEIQFYHEIFQFIQEDIRQSSEGRNMITEGAAFLPELMKECNISNSHYVCITPTKEFQIEHFKKREWISFILDECSDKEQSFTNWMDRDALFAERVRMQCGNAGYTDIITDGRMKIEKMVEIVCRQFEFER